MYATFEDIDGFNSWIETVNGALGFPNEAGTLTYSDPIIHEDNTVIALIDDQIEFDGETIDKDQAILAGYISERIDV